MFQFIWTISDLRFCFGTLQNLFYVTYCELLLVLVSHFQLFWSTLKSHFVPGKYLWSEGFIYQKQSMESVSFFGKSFGVLPLTGTNGSGGRSPGSFLLPPAAFSPPWLGQWEAAGRELPERSWPMPLRHKALTCFFLANGSQANIF